MKEIRSIIFGSILIISTLACSLFSGQGANDLPNPGSGLPQYKPGYEPGWKIFSNANFVNGIAYYDNTLWAATEGGVVMWDLRTDEAVKFTPLDGLGQLSTYDVVVCPLPDIKLVVATEKGLSFYDFKSHSWDTSPITPDDSHVNTNKINKLFCDQENSRLLLGYRGLGILDVRDGLWKQYLEDDGLAWNSVNGITSTGTAVWVAGYKGISIVDNGKIQVLNETGGMLDESTNSVVTDSNGMVWAATDGGLVKFANGKPINYSSDTVDGMSGSLDVLTLSADSTLWVSSSSGRICQFDISRETCVYTYEGDTDYFSNDMTSGEDGDIYISTYGGGIWAFDGSEWRNLYIKDDQLVGNFVEAFTEDTNGMMWVATDKGVQRFDPNNMEDTWQTFDAGENGPASNWAQGIFNGPSGEMWFANDSKYVSMFDGSTWMKYGPDEGIPGSVNAIASGTNGEVFIGTSEGLLIMSGNNNRILTDAEGLPGKVVRSLLMDGDTLWIGTTDGLASLQNGSVKTVLDSSSEGLPSDNISVLRLDNDGALLLGTTAGLAQYDGGQVSLILEPQSISGLFGESVNSISDIGVSGDGTLWVGTYAGLYHGNGHSWEHFTTADGLPTNNINAVFVNKAGIVWVGGGYTRSGGGIARFIPGDLNDSDSSDLDEVQEGSGNSNRSDQKVSYDENTGMPLYADAEQVYSTESVLNYWSTADFVVLRDFYLAELPNIGWLLDLDENGNCRDDDRCMGWHRGYEVPDNQTFFFLKGEKGYITLNLIPESGKVNVVIGINEPE